MASEIQLYARAILLEELRNESRVEDAVKKVHAELGRNAITGEDVAWYEDFKKDQEKGAKNADVLDGCLMKSGTFLRSKRSLVSELDGFGNGFMCRTYTADNRFQILHKFNGQTNWIVDTFNGTKKEISIDSCAIEQLLKPCYLGLLYFIGNTTVCGVVHRRAQNKGYWFKGDFNVNNLVLRVDTVEFIGYNDYQFDNRARPPTLNMLTPNSAISWTIDMSNGNLSEPKRNNLRDSIWPSMIADGKLFGFAVDQNLIVNPNKLCEVSMVDGTKIEHEIEEKENMEISYYSTPYLWTNGQLLVGIEQHNLCTVSAIFKFDIARMKWEKTGIEVDGKIESMIVNDGMLIVYAFSPKNGLKQIYRFQYETVDLLANLIWLSMRRYSQHNPRFQRWFLSQLPKTHKFRGLETSGERKH